MSAVCTPAIPLPPTVPVPVSYQSQSPLARFQRMMYLSPSNPSKTLSSEVELISNNVPLAPAGRFGQFAALAVNSGTAASSVLPQNVSGVGVAGTIPATPALQKASKVSDAALVKNAHGSVQLAAASFVSECPLFDCQFGDSMTLAESVVLSTTNSLVLFPLSNSQQR